MLAQPQMELFFRDLHASIERDRSDGLDWPLVAIPPDVVSLLNQAVKLGFVTVDEYVDGIDDRCRVQLTARGRVTFGLRVGALPPPLPTIPNGFQIEPWMRELMGDLHEASLVGRTDTIEFDILAVPPDTMTKLHVLRAAGILHVSQDLDGLCEHIRIRVTDAGRQAFILPAWIPHPSLFRRLRAILDVRFRRDHRATRRRQE